MRKRDEGREGVGWREGEEREEGGEEREREEGGEGGEREPAGNMEWGSPRYRRSLTNKTTPHLPNPVRIWRGGIRLSSEAQGGV